MSGSNFRGDPYRVLDVRHDASDEEVKLRWRELAREHHPDRAGEDGKERARLTTRMARINAAYDVLRDPVRRARYDSTPHARRDRFAESGPPEGYGPPPPQPTRPVTARFDTSALFRPRNSTMSDGGAAPRRAATAGQPPRRAATAGQPPRRATTAGLPPVEWREYRQGPDLRASKPNGPVYRTIDPRKAQVPSLEDARATVLGFGRFHGQTLGDVADREPTYVDWIASTITRDRDLVMCARVIATDLDARGVERRPRVAEA